MALAHQFIIRGMEQEFLFSEETEYVFVSDYLMQYMGDSMRWVRTNWNDQIEVDGFPEEGFAIITEVEVEHILKIVQHWKALFLISPEQFCLTIQEKPGLGEREVEVTRQEIMEEMEGWIGLCTLAVKQKSQLIYKGL